MSVKKDLCFCGEVCTIMLCCLSLRFVLFCAIAVVVQQTITDEFMTQIKPVLSNGSKALKAKIGACSLALLR